MSTANPPFYTGPDLALPDAGDFLHNPSTSTTTAGQGVGDTSELDSADSKGTFLLDWNLHYDEQEASVPDNLPDSSLFSDLLIDFGNQSFPPDQILELNSPGMEIFTNEEILSPKRSKLLPPFSGPAQVKSSRLPNTNTAKKEPKPSGVLDCICNQPQANRFILVCDKCDKWFHCECVGISQEQGEEMSRERHIWLCPVCNESTLNKTQSNKHTEPRSHIATRSQNKLEAKVPIVKIHKRSLPAKEGKRCYLKSCQKRLTNPNYHFCSNSCIEVTVNNLRSFYQIKGLPSADSERVTLLDKSNMKVITGVSAPTLGGLASWLKSHLTHVPIKPQPRPSQDPSAGTSKHEMKLEYPVSNHEEIVRGKARKQLTDILMSRIESSPEYAKYSEAIPKVASQIEVALYALDGSISTRYKNRYRSLSFSLRDPKNVGLYRKVVFGETPPENLVQMSTEQLAPETSNSSKEAKNNSNTDISTTRSKTHDKQQTSGDFISGEMAWKNVHNQPKSQDLSKCVFDEKNKQAHHGSKQLKPQANKSNDIPPTPLMTTEVDIPPPKFSPTLSDSDEHSDMDRIVWRGTISMPNLAKCATNGCLAYGPYIPDMEKILPQNVQVHGRIVYSMVWDYLKKIISSTTKGLVVLRLVPKTPDEENSFTTLFNYFHKRQRCGVAGGCTATVRDLYLLPFTKGDVIPTLLTSLQGPGVPTLKGDTLLVMIVTNRTSESSPHTAAMKRSTSETDTTITAESRANGQKANSGKQDISLTNPSTPLPFASIHSKGDLPFSSNTSKSFSDPASVPSNEIASKLFNPSDLYKPISESDSSDKRKDSYMIPYDKAESETPFKLGFASTSAGDHIFPGLGEILKKSMDDPIIEDALSNLHFKKPIKEAQFTPETAQKLHTEYGVQYQDQYGDNPHSAYVAYPGTAKPGEGGHLDFQAMRSQPQGQHSHYPLDSHDPNAEQYNRSQSVSYYGQEQGQHTEHRLQGQQYPPQEAQVYAHNTTDYWQQEDRDAQHKPKQHDVAANQQYQPEGFPQQQWGTTSHAQTAKNPQQRQYEQEYSRYQHGQNEQHRQHEEYTRLQKHDSYPPSQTPQDHTSPQHRLSLQLQAHRQTEEYRRPAHEYPPQTEHVSEYADPRLQRDQYQEDRYFDRECLDKEAHSQCQDESERNRDPYSHQYNPGEVGRDWKPPYEQLRDEEKWTGNERRSLDRDMAGGGYRQEREEKGREEEMHTWELERAYRLADAEFVDRPLPPYLRRRLPLRTALTHLDLARRDIGSFRGRGSSMRPSLLERDRARMKRDIAPDSNMLGVPFKLYRTIESPPKPSFEPISRPRATLRVRKRDRGRKSPKSKSRDDPKDEESNESRRERRSRRRSRFSRSRDVAKRDEPNNRNQQQQDKPADKTQHEHTDDKPNEAQPESATEEIYPQVVQEVDNNNKTVSLDTNQTGSVSSHAEDERLSKFPPKHLQREKLLAMQEKLHNSSPSKVSERSERGKHRSRSRSRERDGKSGRRRRSRSREWGKRTHSRDEVHRGKEPGSLIRERLLREREAQPSLRERQLLVLERERELFRARARFSLPTPGVIDSIRDRSPLRMADLDPRRPFVAPLIRSRALDELRRERIERGVPGGVFRGQYVFQGPRQ